MDFIFIFIKASEYGVKDQSTLQYDVSGKTGLNLENLTCYGLYSSEFSFLNEYKIILGENCVIFRNEHELPSPTKIVKTIVYERSRNPRCCY